MAESAVLVVTTATSSTIKATIVFTRHPQLGCWGFLRVNQFKVNLALILVYSNQFNLDWLTDLEDMMMAAANQCHVGFQILVEVIVHDTDMDQAFNGIFQGYEQAKLHDGTNNGIKGLANMIFHVFCLLHAVNVAFRINTPPFGNRGVLSYFWQPVAIFSLGFFCRAVFSIPANQAVHHFIRITTNWRGKVRIVLGTQTKVTDFFISILSLLHTAQHHHLDHLFFWLASHAL